MLDALKGIISSKKWIGVLIAVAVAVLVQYGVIGADLGHQIEILLGIGVAGQAVADHGKEAAKVNLQVAREASSAGAVSKTGIATSPGGQ